MDDRRWDGWLELAEDAEDPHDGRARFEEVLAAASEAGVRRAAASAAISLANYHISMSEFDAATAMCRRAMVELGDASAPLERARLALAQANVEPDRVPDTDSLRAALPVLEGHGRWEEASDAAAQLAQAAARDGRAEVARQFFCRAIGAAEARGGRVHGPALLRALASFEIGSGQPKVGERLLGIALRRLAPVLLLRARLEEASCVECLGDAAEAQHRTEDARAHYQDALDRLRTLEAGGSDRIRRKLQGPSERLGS